MTEKILRSTAVFRYDATGTEETMGEIAEDRPLTEEEKAKLKRAKRGCLVAFLPLWIGLVLAVGLGIMFLLGDVERDPVVIEAHVAAILEMDVPEGFYPFSSNAFLGTRAISYYHRDHLREDGRTTSVISITHERAWRNMTAAELEAEVLEKLEERLANREMTIQDKKPIPVDRDGERFVIYQFTGRQLMDAEMLMATTCFRFLDGPNGAFQVQTMGLDDSFPVEQQVAVLSSIRARP